MRSRCARQQTDRTSFVPLFSEPRAKRVWFERSPPAVLEYQEGTGAPVYHYVRNTRFGQGHFCSLCEFVAWPSEGQTPRIQLLWVRDLLCVLFMRRNFAIGNAV